MVHAQKVVLPLGIKDLEEHHLFKIPECIRADLLFLFFIRLLDRLKEFMAKLFNTFCLYVRVYGELSVKCVPQSFYIPFLGMLFFRTIDGKNIIEDIFS